MKLFCLEFYFYKYFDIIETTSSNNKSVIKSNGYQYFQFKIPLKTIQFLTKQNKKNKDEITSTDLIIKSLLITLKSFQFFNNKIIINGVLLTYKNNLFNYINIFLNSNTIHINNQSHKFYSVNNSLNQNNNSFNNQILNVLNKIHLNSNSFILFVVKYIINYICSLFLIGSVSIYSNITDKLDSNNIQTLQLNQDSSFVLSPLTISLNHFELNEGNILSNKNINITVGIHNTFKFDDLIQFTTQFKNNIETFENFNE